MCAMCAGRNFQKCEAGDFYFFFFGSGPCPVALLVKSSESVRKIGLCLDMSVVTRHCQCVRCLFLHVPQRSAVWLVADFEALTYQVTSTFDTSCAARIRTAPAINYTAC